MWSRLLIVSILQISTYKSDNRSDSDFDVLLKPIVLSQSPNRNEWIPAADALGFLASTDVKSREIIWTRSKINSAGIKFSQLPPGEFEMGPDIPGTDTGEPAHRVRITKPFFISVTETTNAQMSRIIPSYRPHNPSWSLPDQPAVGLRWEEAKKFCEELSKVEGVTYRLPTEAEWEYACRAGSQEPYCFGGDTFSWPVELESYAFCAQPKAPPARVASFKPNAWGLYDMHGNAFEWVSDWCREDTYQIDAKQGIVSDPQGPNGGFGHVLRGGDWPSVYSLTFTSTRRFRPSFFLGKPILLAIMDPKVIDVQQTYGFRVVRNDG